MAANHHQSGFGECRWWSWSSSRVTSLFPFSWLVLCHDAPKSTLAFVRYMLCVACHHTRGSVVLNETNEKYRVSICLDKYTSTSLHLAYWSSSCGFRSFKHCHMRSCLLMKNMHALVEEMLTLEEMLTFARMTIILLEGCLRN